LLTVHKRKENLDRQQIIFLSRTFIFIPLIHRKRIPLVAVEGNEKKVSLKPGPGLHLLTDAWLPERNGDNFPSIP